VEGQAIDVLHMKAIVFDIVVHSTEYIMHSTYTSACKCKHIMEQVHIKIEHKAFTFIDCMHSRGNLISLVTSLSQLTLQMLLH